MSSSCSCCFRRLASCLAVFPPEIPSRRRVALLFWNQQAEQVGICDGSSTVHESQIRVRGPKERSSLLVSRLQISSMRVHVGVEASAQVGCQFLSTQFT